MKWMSGFFLVGIFVFIFEPAQALPVQAGYVNDFTAKLSPNNVAQLEAFLKDHDEKTGHAFYVVIVQDMEGQSDEAYAQQLTESWGLKDSHLLILIALDESILRISVGNALTELYPDALLEGVKNDMITLLAQGLFDQAVSQGVSRLVGLPAEQGKAPVRHNSSGDSAPWRLVLLGGLVVLSLGLYFFFLA